MLQKYCSATFFLILQFVISSFCYGEELTITDKNSPDKLKVISNLLALQQSWQVDIRSQKNEVYENSGFLFVRMKPESVLDLLDNKDSKIIWVKHNDEMAGYIILTTIQEFFDLYVNSSIRTFEGDNLPLLEEYLISNDVKYIEQIAISINHVKKGIGIKLVNAAKELSPKGLVCAILTKPFKNQASLRFFSHHGFLPQGHLNCIECADWPTYQTRVLFWSPHNYKN